jgi:polysaccharide export outer membrane protein
MLQCLIRQCVPRCILLCVLAFTMSMVVSVSDGFSQGTGLEGLGQIFGPGLLDQILRSQGMGGVIESPSSLDIAREEMQRSPFPMDVSGSQEGMPLFLPLEEPSPIEADYSERANQVLTQFGYEVFTTIAPPQELVTGAISDGYRLGIGDEIVATFIGQTERAVRTRVDRAGRVILPEMPPISAAGRSFGEFRRDLEAQTRASFLGTEVYVSIGAVRSVSVMVTGEVMHPGVYNLTGLSTLFDALVYAGGIEKTGSLRALKVIRGDTIFWLDIYDLLFTGFVDRDVTVVDGDRIVVPTLGPTVAVAGKVRRPGIYELAEGMDATSLSGALDFAGGTLRPRGNRILHIGFQENGQQTVDEVDDPARVQALDGDIVLVDYSQDIQVGYVEIVGHVRVEGRQSIATSGTLRALLSNTDVFKENPYLLLGVIERTDSQTQARRMHPVNLTAVLADQIDVKLEPDDRVIVLSSDDVRFLSAPVIQRVLAGEVDLENTPFGGTVSPGKGDKFGDINFGPGISVGAMSSAQFPSQQSTSQTASPGFDSAFDVGGMAGEKSAEVELCKGLVRLASLVSTGNAARFTGSHRATDPNSEEKTVDLTNCPDIFMGDEDLLPLLLEHVVSLNGAVRAPGAYPIVPGTSIASVLAVAGGIAREADLTNVELSRFIVNSAAGISKVDRRIINFSQIDTAAFAVEPGDVVVFNPVFVDREDGPVEIAGEVLRPGFYYIQRGERLSEVIERAGGLTPQAYVYGAVFTRERVKEAERLGFQRAATELEAALATALTRQTSGPERGQSGLNLESMGLLVANIRWTEPLGRVVIESDPTVLALHPELDTILEPGDFLFIPKRPNFVSVIGEILNPTSLQYLPGLEADAYIEQAGGERQSADIDRAFVILPDGTAQALQISFWNYTATPIPPGSTIVVPRDTSPPFDLFAFTTELTRIIGQLAVSAASIVVITDR